MQTFCGAAILLLTLAMPAAAQTERGCPAESAIREQFGASQLPAYPNLTEGPGARVQHQHPSTHLFGQTKLVIVDGKTPFVLCQYSNHVGSVVTFGSVAKAISDSPQGCSTTECRSKPWWRTEYVESNPADKKLMQVCVIDRDGETFPSLGCKFTLGQDR